MVVVNYQVKPFIALAQSEGVLLGPHGRLSHISLYRIPPTITSSLTVLLNFHLGDMEDAIVQPCPVHYPHLCPNLKSVTIHHDSPRRLSQLTNRSQSIFLNGCLKFLILDAPIDAVTLAYLVMSEKFKELHMDLRQQFLRILPHDIIPFRNVYELSLEIFNLDFAAPLL